MIYVHEFRPIFLRVADDFALTPEARAAAWDACVGVSGGTEYLHAYPVRLYRMLYATRPPYRAQGHAAAPSRQSEEGK